MGDGDRWLRGTPTACRTHRERAVPEIGRPAQPDPMRAPPCIWAGACAMRQRASATPTPFPGDFAPGRAIGCTTPDPAQTILQGSRASGDVPNAVRDEWPPSQRRSTRPQPGGAPTPAGGGATENAVPSKNGPRHPQVSQGNAVAAATGGMGSPDICAALLLPSHRARP